MLCLVEEKDVKHIIKVLCERGHPRDKKVIGKLKGTLPKNPEERKAMDAYREQAKQKHIHDEGNIEVDDGAVVSLSGDGGAYVQAWTWIGDEDDSE